MLHAVAGLLAAGCTSGGWIETDCLHLRAPLRVVVAAGDRLIVNVLPEVYHFVREDREDVLVSLADEVIRVEIDFVLMIILGIAVDVTIRRKVTARVSATLEHQERIG